ncbi:uncharacterized protein ACR2FA_003285 [Aphomia sociella]
MWLSVIIAWFMFVLTSGLSPVDQIRKKLYTIEEQQWTKINSHSWRTSGFADIKLAEVFVRFHNDIQRIPLSHLPVSSGVVLRWWETPQKQIQDIEKTYKTFLDFMKRQAEPGVAVARVMEWLGIALSVLTDPKTYVSQSMSQLRRSVVHNNLFQNVLKEQNQYFNRSRLCELQASPHQLIYDMYSAIELAEIKGYAMTQFSWMLLKIYRAGNITEEAIQTRARHRQGAIHMAKATRRALTLAKRELYRCDPIEHVEGKTYDQVTRLLQGYIENEVDMNSENTCSKNCDYYKVASNHGCFKDQFCSRQPRCGGIIVECQFVESHMTVCLAGTRSHRRYEWIEYYNGKMLGKKTECNKFGKRSNKVESWWRWLFWHCSYCMCLCDDAENSDRYFSLREVTSDIENNKVVTGVRLVKHKSVFHLQISQGVLHQNGFVSPGSWVPVKKFNIADGGITENEDYHKLTYENRAIDFDDVVASKDRVLTGVKFQMLGAHLNLVIRATKFSFENGRLVLDNSMWISNDNTDGASGKNKPRTRLELHRPDLPTQSDTPLPVDSSNDQFLEFTHSDFQADAAQSTVPFIDVQPVEPYNGGALLSGAGVIHRGVHGSGGFIALKLFTYDFSQHVQPETPVDE